ncbi:MAG: hypothetical protein IJD18_01300 [Clostridia bacterium]|nr:hypothetical protein [Clostridia bacterium]MBQ3066640.1 hypothetical protein [Clostridia bacterium]
MPKSKQNNHEYYANYETCRNRMFDLCDMDDQIEDFHLDFASAFLGDDNANNGK